MTTEVPKENAFAGYAILELMGHRRLGGYVREMTFAGAAVIRLDVPRPDAPCWANSDPPAPADIETSQVYGGGSLFCLTPCKPSVARAIAKHARPLELHYLEERELQLALPAPASSVEPPEDAELEEEDEPY